jgi:hypothetical protein
MICLTVSLYGLVREHGAEEALALFQRQLENPLDPAALPCARAITRLRGVDEIVVHADIGASATPKMRSRAAHAAFVSGADLWVSIDDDVEATFETMQALVEACRSEPRPLVVFAPCWLRGKVHGDERHMVECINAAFEADAPTQARILPSSGARCFPAVAGGFGLVAMTRATLEHALATNTHLSFRDDDGEERVGLFHEDLADGRWWGEDLSFFRHLPPDVRIEALATGHTAHAGMVLDLSTLTEHTRMRLEGFRVVHDGILEDAPVASPPAATGADESTPPPG